MKFIYLNLFIFQLVIGSSYAHDLSLNYDKTLNKTDHKVIEETMEEVSLLLPKSFKDNLPRNIKIKIEQLSDHTFIPTDNCQETSESVRVEQEIKSNSLNYLKQPFVYGKYKQFGNTLTLNKAILNELALGKKKSKRIDCQHKSLYDQAVATIIHELTHAYDFNLGRISNSLEFVEVAGFKKGLFKIKNKNIQAMRSADTYELVNIVESFAVNMEYFIMDSEFMCRKPSMFNYYKRLLGVDPFPNRKCESSNIVMTSTQMGYLPKSLLASRVYRIDYLLASAGKGLSSGFGHTMLRLVICAPERFDPITAKMIPATPFGKKCLEDRLHHLVVSYRANIDDGKLSYIKGLFGGYPSMLFILNFSDVLDEYNKDELRDIISYPLNLTSKERDDFITRIKEEHWNYRGAYKFVTNNCAVESYDLLKSALDRSQLQSKKSVTPNGVLKDLDKLGILSVNDVGIENFKAKTDQIILAYNKAYSYKLKKNDKSNKDAVLKFIDKSIAANRMSEFNKFKKSEILKTNMNAEVTQLKERLIVSSSFSVMEQQIIRSLALKYRKEAADMFMNTKDENIKVMIKETGTALSHDFLDLSGSGYGIPLDEEMISSDELNEKLTASSEVLAKADKLLRDLMPEEFGVLEEINNNILTYNKYSLELRKEFRLKLEIYINQVLKNMSREDYTKEILLKASQGEEEYISKVREFIGKDLVTNKEILDSKLIKLIKKVI